MDNLYELEYYRLLKFQLFERMKHLALDPRRFGFNHKEGMYQVLVQRYDGEIVACDLGKTIPDCVKKLSQ